MDIIECQGNLGRTTSITCYPEPSGRLARKGRVEKAMDDILATGD